MCPEYAEVVGELVGYYEFGELRQVYALGLQLRDLPVEAVFPEERLERRTFPIAIDLLSFGLIRHVPVAVCLRDINQQTGTPLILFAQRLSEIAFQFARCVKVRNQETLPFDTPYAAFRKR